MKRKIIIFLITLGLVGVAATALRYFEPDKTGPIEFRTGQVSRGDLVITVSSTGTVEPEEVIDVGTQVAGRIVSFGEDAGGETVDYGSVVEEGTVLARIDESLYAAEVAGAEAGVQFAGANLLRTEADLQVMKAKFHQAERDWQRAQKLDTSEVLALSSYDAYKSAYESAKANIAVSEATIQQARASLAQAGATLSRAQQNLGYCTIKSPVKGIVIDRRVNIGQTVVSSLNTPSLFLLAKDLKRMQVWVAVNEADLGKIRIGQRVTFTVDALPGETFEGEVGKIRLNASMTQNVVLYTVEVITDNEDGRLLPYLTASVHFEVNRRNDILLVPNAALRWTPPNGRVNPESSMDPGSSRAAGSISGVMTKEEAEQSHVNKSEGRGVIWIQQGERIFPVNVITGLSDGVMTEIQSEGVTEGMTIIVGSKVDAQRRNKRSRETSNPFMTDLPPRRGDKRGGSQR